MEPNEVVAYVESEMSQSRSCPMCGQYGGLEQHQAGCVYLTYKGMATTPEESPDGGGPSLQSNSLDADVVSADETPLPVLTPEPIIPFEEFVETEFHKSE